jgi:hypothetical protein
MYGAIFSAHDIRITYRFEVTAPNGAIDVQPRLPDEVIIQAVRMNRF